MISPSTLTIVLDVVALVGALWITLVSYGSYRDSRIRMYRTASIGFGFLALGVASEAVLFRVGNVGMTTAHTIESLLFLVGFVFLYVSLK